VTEPRRSRRAAPRFELEVVHGPPPPGTTIDGPAVVELLESTVLVAPGWRAETDDVGTIRMRRAR
jgi:N-methylhydantoinase A/oxoprolinase/acetone carboxylase beta subunit